MIMLCVHYCQEMVIKEIGFRFCSSADELLRKYFRNTTGTVLCFTNYSTYFCEIFDFHKNTFLVFFVFNVNHIVQYFAPAIVSVQPLAVIICKI